MATTSSSFRAPVRCHPDETTGLTRTQIGYQTTTPDELRSSTNNLGETKGSFFGGGSITTLTNGGNAPSPVVYGSVVICNGETFPLQSNQTNFVGTVVYGSTDVTNDPLLPGGTTRHERAKQHPRRSVG